MPRAKNCNVTSSTIEDANEHINKTIQEIDMEIDRLIDDDFGKVFGKESKYAQSIIDNKDEVMLPFNMLEDEECNVDILIEYYEGEEEYERCAELMNFRNGKKSSVCI